jgi:exodeoxyribonuclease-3
MGGVVAGLSDEAGPSDARLIRATIGGVRIHSVYVPNGKEPTSPSFAEKLAFFDRLRRTIESESSREAPVLLCGDFNVAPEDRDVFDPEALRGRLLFHPDEHGALSRLVEFGFVDLFRLHHEEAGRYSWWDYRAGAFRRNHGLRIDLMLGTPSVAARCTACEIDVDPRRWEKPSDHVPVVASLD